jgi:hypothetical protein
MVGVYESAQMIQAKESVLFEFLRKPQGWLVLLAVRLPCDGRNQGTANLVSSLSGSMTEPGLGESLVRKEFWVRSLEVKRGVPATCF